MLEWYWEKSDSKILEGKEEVYALFTLCPLAPEQCLAHMRCSLNVGWNNLGYNHHSSESQGINNSPRSGNPLASQGMPTQLRPFPIKPPVTSPVSSLTSFNPDCHFSSEHLWCLFSSLQEPFISSPLSIYQLLPEGKEHFLSLHSVKQKLLASCGYNPFTLGLCNYWLIVWMTA